MPTSGLLGKFSNTITSETEIRDEREGRDECGGCASDPQRPAKGHFLLKLVQVPLAG